MHASDFLANSDVTSAEDFERLSLALLRYAYNPEAMCDDVIADADSLSMSFLRGWFSSRDVVEVMRPAIGRVVRANHVHENDHSHESHESHEEEEEDHEDEDHDHDHERRRRDNHDEEEDHADDEDVETATEDSHDHDDHSEEEDHEDDEYSHSEDQ